MYDNAIKDLRTYFLMSLLIIFIWLISWPTAVERITNFQEAQHLQAWLLLKEQVEKIDVDNILEREIDEITSYNMRYEVSGRSEYLTADDLQLTPHWPEQNSVPLLLKLRTDDGISDSARIYTIETPSSLLPFENYQVVFLPSGAGTLRSAIVAVGDLAFESDAKNGLRSLLEATKRRYHPKHWFSLQNRLRMFGYTDILTKLKSSDPALQRLYSASDPRDSSAGVQIFGINLSIGLFFFTVGFFLAAIAFVSFGPLLVLTKSRNQESSSTWIFAAPFAPRTLLESILENTIRGIGWLWAVMPLILLTMQIAAGFGLWYIGVYYFLLGATGLVFSAIVFGIINLQLIKLRKFTQ